MLTTAQVADQLQLSVPLVRKAIRDGRLQASLPAGRKHGYRIAPSAVEHWMTASRAGPGSRAASTAGLS
jgi:excisionase family DNA binding protein